ncbi:MAG: cobalamin-dependent protein [Acidimicrobiia bacterium]|nr:cobalamin-dependent protein [Acidimicrobiia bacterium]
MGSETLSLQKVSEELGVHYMTVYRYVRTGALPARKEGAQWMVSRADLKRYTKGKQGLRGGRGSADWSGRLFSRLVAGDEAGAWKVIESALASGADPAKVVVEILGGAMKRVGIEWARGQLDISAEHRASAISHRLIGRLGPMSAKRGRSRGTVVVGAPKGELHGLGTAMLANVLRSAGFEVHDLGPDVPDQSFVTACEEANRLLAIGISASTAPDAKIKRLVRALRSQGVPIMVGGPAIADERHARALGADGWATDAIAAIEMVESLIAAPSSSG